MDFFDPFDLAGSRGEEATISAKKFDPLLKHLKPKAGDSAMVAGLKVSANPELQIVEAVMTADRCKELVTYLNKNDYRNELPETPKQEVSSRWNSQRRMLSSLEIQSDEVCSPYTFRGHLSVHHIVMPSASTLRG